MNQKDQGSKHSLQNVSSFAEKLYLRNKQQKEIITRQDTLAE